MTIAPESRVGDLVTEFLADTLIFLPAFQPAGTIAAGTLQALPDGFDHFLIFIQTNRHSCTSFLNIIIVGIEVLSRVEYFPLTNANGYARILWQSIEHCLNGFGVIPKRPKGLPC